MLERQTALNILLDLYYGTDKYLLRGTAEARSLSFEL